jgi:hypothetical protein
MPWRAGSGQPRDARAAASELSAQRCGSAKQRSATQTTPACTSQPVTTTAWRVSCGRSS